MERLDASLNWSKARYRNQNREIASVHRKNGTVIYFIKAGNFLKVGISSLRSLKARVNAIQVGNPFQVKVLKLLHTTNPMVDEAKFHSVLDRYHIRGEWFALQPENEIMKFLTGERPLVWPQS